MSNKLTKQEVNCLKKLYFDHNRYYLQGELAGIGITTLNSLYDKGLIEKGMSKRHNSEGWRFGDNAWLCLFAHSKQDIKDGIAAGKTFDPLRNPVWPVDKS